MSTFRQNADEGPYALELSSLTEAHLARFIAGTRGEGLLLEHTPGLIWAPSQLSALGWIGVFSITFAFVVGFGGVEAQPAWAPARLGVFTIGMFALTLRMLLARRRKKLVGKLPYVPGVYVFSHVLIDARSATILVRPLLALSHTNTVEMKDGSRCLSMRFSDGSGYTFSASSQELARFIAHKQLLDRGHVNRSEQNDPLTDAPLELRRRISDEGLQPSAASWQMPVFWLVPLLASILVSPAWLFARDMASDWMAISLATSRGDDEALAKLSSVARPLATRADDAWFSLALSSPDPTALSRYVYGGGHHSTMADRAQVDRLIRNGSESAMETYLQLGGVHRHEVFDELLRRGLTERNTAALLVYERQLGPETALVRAAYLPCAEMLGPSGAALPAKALRRHFVSAEHPMRRETASGLLRARIDAMLAKLPAKQDPAQPNWRALLTTVRASDGELGISFAALPSAPPRAVSAPRPKALTKQTPKSPFTELTTHPAKPVTLSPPLIEKVQDLLLAQIQAEFDNRFEPDLVKLVPNRAPSASLPELVVQYQFEQDIRYLETEYTDVPLLVQFHLTGDAVVDRFQTSATVQVRFITHKLEWSWKRCPEFGLERGCTLPIAFETPKLSAFSEEPLHFRP